MIEEIFKNLIVSNNEKLNIISVLNSDTSTYIINEYNKLFSNWNKEYPMFNIPSGLISISINGLTKYINVGNTKYDENTIFDIASMTKLYTEFILFEVLDEYNIDINTKIKDLVDFYVNINELTLLDLISFNNTYITCVDTRACTNKTEALKALRTVYIVPEKSGYYLYTDLPIMILTDILETITNKSYYELFNKYIIEKYKLNNTYLVINDNKKYVTLNNNFVNDPKANIFGGFYGHAGVKTSSKDFITFLNSAFDSKYSYLFTKTSKTKNINYDLEGKLTNNLDIEHLNTYDKSIIGNININHTPFKQNDYKFTTLVSNNLPLKGFAVQGSVRCQGETCILYINNKEYRISISIFLDLYTQLDNAKKYEEITNKKIIIEYDINNSHLYMVDIRNVLPYNPYYKKLLEIVGNARIIEVYNYIKK